jgi:uncharacterized metal-binding protein YceD (DUF177 family)
MTEGLPLAHSYNLARLGNAGDEVRFAADAAALAQIARWADIPLVEKFEVRVELKKLAPNRFGLAFHLLADVTQSCVVTLDPVPGHLERNFSRELVFVGPQRHNKPALTESLAESETVLDSGEEEGPEEIESLHFDLAAPVLEEFALSLDPYPRAPDVEFAPQSPESDRPESPFAVLKGLK